VRHSDRVPIDTPSSWSRAERQEPPRPCQGIKAQAKTGVQNIRGRDRGALYFRLFFAEVRDRVVDSGRLDAATLDAASGLLDDPDYWTQCWMMTAVWARKPAA
jgi:hypothetical protein